MYSTLPSTDVESSSWSGGHMHFIEVCKPFTMVATSPATPKPKLIKLPNRETTNLKHLLSQHLEYAKKFEELEAKEAAVIERMKKGLASFVVKAKVETIQGHENACYKLSTAPKNFFDAETDCESSNGYLTSVVNGFENSLISKIARDYLSTQKQFWIGGNKISSAWTWTDGTPFTYTNWAAGQPDSSDQCISVTSSNSQWSSIDCNTAQYYICKIQATVDNGSITTCPTNKPVIPDTTVRPITINDCESGWTYYNITNLCYKVFHGQTCNQSEATCVQNGGHLASIHSLEENVFISQLAQAGYTFGNDGYWGRYHVLIGLMDPTLNGNFYWTDGSPYDYQSWCDSYKYTKCCECTTLVADQETEGCFQEWTTDYEETPHRAFVCQKSSIAHICQN
uniref:C-type lectin domain-containing protein n=1 Tax=Acrobeloides nanus TaxID=290746 RepID=A0A914CMI2_9BILA